MERQSRSPNVVGLCVCKNEQDIIEPFVRHNLRFLDSLLVLDNGSVDNTRTILTELTKEFRGLVIGEDDKFAHTQSARTTRMFRSAHLTYKPDYIIPLDADEFLGVPDRSLFWTALKPIPPGGYGLMPWRTFVLTPGTVSISAEDPPKSLQWRRREESPMFHKIVVRPDGLDVSDLVIEHGNHVVKSVSGRSIPFVNLEGLCLMHVPVRSRDQFITKVVVGWIASFARDPEIRSSGWSWHKRDDFDRIAGGHAIDDNALCEFSFLYAQSAKPIDWQTDVVKDDPHFDYVRKYSTGKPLDAIQLIARSWEQSLPVCPRALETDDDSAQHAVTKTLPANQSAEYALAILLDVYQRRPDLHKAFPEVKNSEHSLLIDWALGVSARRWDDADCETLRPYEEWYSALSNRERVLREEHRATAETNRAIAEKNQAIAEKDRAVAEKQKAEEFLLAVEDLLRREQNARMAMERSLSWRVTEPIRKAMTAIRSGPRKTR
jgi:Glycosyl transferase family 2